MKIDLNTTKHVLNLSAQIGAGTIAFAVARNSVSTPNPLLKVAVGCATFALAHGLASKAGNDMNALVDEVVALVNQKTTKILFV